MYPLPNHFLKQKLMSVASLFEDEFTIDWLIELTGFKAQEILAELQEEIDKKTLISPKLGIYSFKTQRKREIWTEKAEDVCNFEIHRRIVDFLLRDLPDDDAKWEKLSHHLMKIPNDLEGCLLLVRSGDVHLKCFRTEQAFQCYYKILEDLRNLDGKDPDILFVDTAIKFSKISTARYDTQQVIAILDEAMTRAKKWDNRSYQALLEMHLAKNEWLRTNFALAMAHFENGWALVKQLDDQQLIDSVTVFGTFFMFWQGRFREAIENYERSMQEVVEKYPQARFPILGKMTVGYCYAQIGNYTQGLGMLDAIRAYCEERGDLYLASFAIGNIGEFMLDMRHLDEAIYYMEQSAEMSSKSNNPWVFMLSQVFLAFTYYLKGNIGHALELLNVFFKHRNEAGANVLPYPYLLALV